MREILFRGKRIRTGQWDVGSLASGRSFCGEYGKGKFYILDNNCPMYTEVIPSTIGEYTGVKDRSGARIFEGDIVTADDYITGSDYDGRTFVVKVIECGFYLSPVAEGDAGAIPFFNECADYAILGNVHENPELLEAVSAEALEEAHI